MNIGLEKAEGGKMILEKKKTYYVNKKVVAFNYTKFYGFVWFIIILFCAGVGYLSTKYFMEKFADKAPIMIEIKSEEVIRLTDLLVKNKIGNGSLLQGYEGNWSANIDG